MPEGDTWTRAAPPIPSGDAGDPRLLIWLSPAFPVGAYAYSHGLELAVERGWLEGVDGLEAWLCDLTLCGSLRNDLILLAEAWRATTASDLVALGDVAALALALQPSAERRLESVTQGNAFLATVSTAWPSPRLAAARPCLGDEVTYPVALGCTAAAHAIACEAMLVGYGTAFVSNLVSAAIRLSVVGQTDGQRVISALMAPVRATAQFSSRSSLDDLGSATLLSDLASLAHETQYTRLFRS